MIRYPEIDITRSAAVIGMIIYHGAYDLTTFYGYEFTMMQGNWLLLQRTVAITFLLLVGTSFAISYNRTPAEKKRIKFLKRGLVVLACGFLVSLATYMIDPVTYVRFGILHIIGTSIMLLPFFTKFRRWNLIIAFAIFLMGSWIRPIIISTHLLLPLGFRPPFFQTVDYFPLLPWFSTVLIGLVIGQTFYVEHITWREKLPSSLLTPYALHLITFPGRHALLIYLIHQPILLAILIACLGWQQH